MVNRYGNDGWMNECVCVCVQNTERERVFATFDLICTVCTNKFGAIDRIEWELLKSMNECKEYSGNVGNDGQHYVYTIQHVSDLLNIKYITIWFLHGCNWMRESNALQMRIKAKNVALSRSLSLSQYHCESHTHTHTPSLASSISSPMISQNVFTRLIIPANLFMYKSST